MDYFCAFLVGLILSQLFMLNTQKRKISIVKLCTLGGGFWMVVYTIISAFLLYFDMFSVKRALECIDVIFLISNIIVLIINKKIRVNLIDWDLKSYVLLLIIMCIGSIFIALKSVPVAPLFDSGCYVSKSLQLLDGGAISKVPLIEYSMVKDEKTREELFELQNNQVGIYRTYVDDGVYLSEYHGLPTWPAFLALSASMFGLDNICLILSFLFVFMVSSMYLFMENIGIRLQNAISALIIFCCSPLVLYLYKLPLSEGLITFLFVFLLFVLSEKQLCNKFIAILSFAALCVSHISIFMYFPIFFVCLFFLFLEKGGYRYVIINVFSCIWLPVSIAYAYKVSYRYLAGNLGTRIAGIDTNKMVMMIGAMSIICLLIQIIASVLLKRRNIFVMKWCKNKEIIFLKMLKIVLAIILIYTIYLAYKIGFTDKVQQGVGSWRFRELYVNKGWESVFRLNIVNIAMAMGWISFPILIGVFFRKRNIGIVQICLNSIWIYSLAIYTFVNIDTPINYSASRYFIIVLVPVAVLAFASIVDSKKVMLFCAITAMLVSIPFNSLLLKTEEYDGNMEFLQDMVEIIDTGAYVMIDLNDNTFVSYNLITNLRELNNNLVFNYESKSVVDSISGSNNVYLVTTVERQQEDLQLILEKNYPYTGELYSLDVVYPLEVGHAWQKVYVYRNNRKNIE